MSLGVLSYPYHPLRRAPNGRALVADAVVTDSDLARSTWPDRDGRRYITGPAEPPNYFGLGGLVDATSASQARTAGRLAQARRLMARRHSHETMLARCATQAAMRRCLERITALSTLIADVLTEAHAGVDAAGVRLREVRAGCRLMVAANDRLRLADAGLIDDDSEGVA